jgi:hypothetical protein
MPAFEYARRVGLADLEAFEARFPREALQPDARQE